MAETSFEGPQASNSSETGADIYALAAPFLYALGDITQESHDRSIHERSWRAQQIPILHALDTELHEARNQAHALVPRMDSTLSGEAYNASLQNIHLIQEKITAKKLEIHDRDRLSAEVRNSKLFTVDMGDVYGKISTLVSILNAEAKGDPIVFLTGAGNQPDSMLNAMVELAWQTKRKVVVYCHPDSPGGSMTPRFAADVIANVSGQAKLPDDAPLGEAVRYCVRYDAKNNGVTTSGLPDHSLHREVARRVINTVIGDSQSFYMGGMSYGGLIAADLLQHNDGSFNSRLKGVLLFNSAGSWDLSADDTFRLNVAQAESASVPLSELLQTNLILDRMHNWSAALQTGNPGNPQKTSILDVMRFANPLTYYRLRDGVTRAIMFSAPHKIIDWDNINAGQTTPLVVIGGNDKATGIQHAISYIHGHRAADPSIIPVFNPEFTHIAMSTQPKAMISAVLDVLPALRSNQ